MPDATVNRGDPSAPKRRDGLAPVFRPLHLVGATLLVLLAVSVWVQWYSREVSLPRYCADPAAATALLRRIVTEERPAREAARRPYLVAAKLLFLIPRKADEPLDPYLVRVRRRLEAACR